MQEKIVSFKELIVWQKAMKLVKEIYVLTEQLPSKELYNLCSQMQRCAVSIPSNIAEGKKRGTKKDFAQFLRIASGSAAELETQILITQEIYKEVRVEEALSILNEVQKILSVIIKKFSE